MKKSKTWTIGIVIGFINGLFGAGGGSLLVPALEKFAKYETHKAHATTVAVILPLSAISAVVYTWGVDVDWGAVLWVSAGGIAGGVAGAKLLSKLAGMWLNILFGLFLATGAIRMIFIA
ncbi:MAG: sulfite exporter TauE/SafE family protein [Firmicutes bacterium]|nr:sulfite exporter TauE/SafE family protein [Bacillota bacterium]